METELTKTGGTRAPSTSKKLSKTEDKEGTKNKTGQRTRTMNSGNKLEKSTEGEEGKKQKKENIIRIGTWNVRTSVGDRYF